MVERYWRFESLPRFDRGSVACALEALIEDEALGTALRSKGLGDALLERAEQTARDRGCTNLSLQLGRHNDRARRFYSAHGFTARSAFELLEKHL